MKLMWNTKSKKHENRFYFSFLFLEEHSIIIILLKHFLCYIVFKYLIWFDWLKGKVKTEFNFKYAKRKFRSICFGFNIRQLHHIWTELFEWTAICVRFQFHSIVLSRKKVKFWWKIGITESWYGWLVGKEKLERRRVAVYCGK